MAFLWRSEAMGVLGKLRKVGDYMRKGWHSINPTATPTTNRSVSTSASRKSAGMRKPTVLLS